MIRWEKEEEGLVITWHEALDKACEGYEECKCNEHLEFINYIIRRGRITNLTDAFESVETVKLVKFLIALTKDNLGDHKFEINHDQALKYVCENISLNDNPNNIDDKRFELIKLIVDDSPNLIAPLVLDKCLHELLDGMTDTKDVPVESVKMIISHGATGLGKYKKVMGDYLFHLQEEGFNLAAQEISKSKIDKLSFLHGFIDTFLGEVGIIPVAFFPLEK